jgi:hypothetical protein
MPVAGHSVKNVMASDPSDFEERYQAKSEADAGEGTTGQAVEEKGDGNGGHIIIDIDTTVIIAAGAIPKKTTPLERGIIVSRLLEATCPLTYCLTKLA